MIVGIKTEPKETGFTVFGSVLTSSQLVIGALVSSLPPLQGSYEFSILASVSIKQLLWWVE